MDSNRDPLIRVEKAKSGRSKCRRCLTPIEKGEVRIGLTGWISGRQAVTWQKPECFIEGLSFSTCKTGRGKCKATGVSFKKGDFRIVMQSHTTKIYIALEETAAINTLHQVLKACPPINATDIDGYNILPKKHKKIADVIFSLAIQNPLRQNHTLKDIQRRDSKHVKFAVGDQIEALWEGGEDRYPGIITCVHSKGTFDVLYEDGDQESEVPGNRICFKELAVGTRVEAPWEGGNVFYPGKVVKVKGGGKYDIKYDDGDYESSVPRSLMRQITSKNVNDVNTPKDIGKSSNIKEEQDADDNSRIKSNSTSLYMPAKSSPKHHTSLKAGPVLKKARTATHQTKMTKTKPDKKLLPTEVKVEKVERTIKNEGGQNPQLSRKVKLSSRVNLSDYELSRQKRISENNAVLTELGLNTSRGGVSSIRVSPLIASVSKQVKSLGLKKVSKRKRVEHIVSHKFICSLISLAPGVLANLIAAFALYQNRDGTHSNAYHLAC